MKEQLTEILKELKALSLQTKDVYTTEEVADLMSTYPAKVNIWAKRGLIVGRKIGRGYRFSKEEVDAFLKRTHGKDLTEYR